MSVNGQVVLRNPKPVLYDKSAAFNRLGPVQQDVPMNNINVPMARPSSSVHKNSPNPRVAVVNKTDIATTTNIYGTLLDESTLGAYNPVVDVLSYTNRANLGTIAAGGNSGWIMTHVSYDKGATWDTTVNVANLTGTNANRYPSGLVANPPGNTTANQAYGVISAPIITNGDTWNGITLASRRLDGQNQSIYNQDTTQAAIYQQMPRLGMSTGTNANVYVMGSNYAFNDDAPDFYGAVINRGVWNGTNNNWDWDHKLIYHAFSHDPSDNSQNFSNLGQMAFNPDGVTGFMCQFGRDSVNDYLSPMPIIYQTTDAGATWNLYSNIDFTPVFTGILPNNAAGFMRPFFVSRHGVDMAVDAYGKLHILTEVAIAYSNDPDSLNYLNYLNAIFDVYELQGGGWNAHFIGSVWTDPTTDTPFPGWAAGWDARLNITRSADGYKMAYTWLDTDFTLSPDTTNLYPDIVGAAADFQNNMSTDTMNWTLNTGYEANNYWLNTSRDGWDNAGAFVVPTFTARALNAGGNDTQPWMHEYVSGIEWVSTDFVNPISTGVSQVTNKVVSALVYPNPAKGNAMVTAEIANAGNVSITLTNTLGQVVKTFDLGNTGAGKLSYNMDITDVKAGFYIVTINADNAKAVSKLNIQ